MSTFVSRPIAVGLALVGALSSGCDEPPPLETLVPSIRVCAEPAAIEAERACGVEVLLGERPITVAASFNLWVVNDGKAPLAVSDVVLGPDSLAAVVEPATFEVRPGEEQELLLTLTPDVLGAINAVVTVKNDDAERPEVTVPVSIIGVPKPVPVFDLCEQGSEACGTDIVVDFGTVRRTQTESRTVEVHNRGDAELTIEAVTIDNLSSTESELRVLTSTTSGIIPPGASADLVVAYAPADALDDTLTLHFTTDDEEHPEGTVTVRGASLPNLPPNAEARIHITGETAVTVSVEQEVTLTGAGSSDPEGDPLGYAWTLSVPEGSASVLDEPNGMIARFTPDRTGTYRAELLVEDSLAQVSEVAAVVLAEATPKNALRVDLAWPTGGDLDLHLVPAGASLFSDADCYFENPRPDLGVAGAEEDDPALVADDETAPGHETVLYTDPPAGAYRVYVHAWTGGGPFAANVTIRIDDASQATYQGTLTLDEPCALWEVGTVTFPERTFDVGPAPTALCP